MASPKPGQLMAPTRDAELAARCEPHMRLCRTAAFVALAIAVLTSHQAAWAEPGDGDPAKAAFGNTVRFTAPMHSSSSKFSIPLAQVPSGKRYVIELVSISCSAQGGVSPAVLTVGQRALSGDSVSTQSFTIPLGTLAVRMYADDITGSPSDVLLTMTHDTFFPVECTASISGYLVSLHGEGE